MFKKLTEDARLPKRATKYSAGFDVFANEDVVIGAGETKLIGLGIALDVEFNTYGEPMIRNRCAMPEFDGIEMLTDHYFAIHIRSSLRVKGLTSLGTGVVDMDYRDEIKMVIHNPVCGLYTKQQGHIGVIGCYTYSSDIYEDRIKHFEIKKGDKIGQLILCRHEGWLLPSEYTKDEERTGGFGSTGG